MVLTLAAGRQVVDLAARSGKVSAHIGREVVESLVAAVIFVAEAVVVGVEGAGLGGRCAFDDGWGGSRKSDGSQEGNKSE